eukprot:Amastigsp_a676288_29.p2 type:complete len:345 gc:universal Amastigsp_a676288_29:1317-283(-)
MHIPVLDAPVQIRGLRKPVERVVEPRPDRGELEGAVVVAHRDHVRHIGCDRLYAPHELVPHGLKPFGVRHVAKMVHKVELARRHVGRHRQHRLVRVEHAHVADKEHVDAPRGVRRRRGLEVEHGAHVLPIADRVKVLCARAQVVDEHTVQRALPARGCVGEREPLGGFSEGVGACAEAHQRRGVRERGPHDDHLRLGRRSEAEMNLLRLGVGEAARVRAVVRDAADDRRPVDLGQRPEKLIVKRENYVCAQRGDRRAEQLAHVVEHLHNRLRSGVRLDRVLNHREKRLAHGAQRACSVCGHGAEVRLAARRQRSHGRHKGAHANKEGKKSKSRSRHGTENSTTV